MLKSIDRFLPIAVGMLLLISPAAAQLSPDQQKQIDQLQKMAQSGQISPTDLVKKIQAIMSGVANHFGGAPGTQKTIPVSLSVSTTWHSQNYVTNPNGTYSQDFADGEIDVHANGSMMAVVNGTANYRDLSAGGASQFTVTCQTAGGGNVHWRSAHQGTSLGIKNSLNHMSSTNEIDGILLNAATGAAMFTNGTDTLFTSSSGGGILSGNRHTHDHSDGDTLVTNPNGTESVKHVSHDEDHDDPNVKDTPTPPGSVGATMEAHSMKGLPSNATKFPSPSIKFSYKDLVDAIAKGTTKTFTSSESFHFTEGITQYAGSGTVTLTLNPKPIQLVIEPEDPGSYDKWLPLPGTDDNHGFNFKGATPMKVHVVLAKPGPSSGTSKTPPNADVSDKFVMSLSNVSQNPGICMNFPQQGASGPTQNGLYFAKNQPDGIVVDDETHVHTSDLVQEATVIVNVRDTAAYGQISAKCDQLGLQSTFARTGKTAMDIPKVQNGSPSHIALYWLEQNSSTDKDADWDDCSSKGGWQSTGDGISLYDKYRGVLIDDGSGNEVFSRIDPTIQNLFIYMPGAYDSAGGPVSAGTGPGTAISGAPHKDLLQAGCALYGKTAGVKVTYIHSSDRLTQLNAAYPNWLTFNQTSHSKSKQCAVVIYDDGKPFDIRPDGSRHEATGTTYSIDGVNDAISRDPTQISRIVMRYTACANAIDTWVSALLMGNPPASVAGFQARFNQTCRSMGLDPATIGANAKSERDQLVNGMLVFSTCHEIGHATGAQHHGLNADGSTDNSASDDIDCPMHYWQGIWIDDENVITFDTVDLLAGKWDLSFESPKNHAWNFCSVDKQKMRIKPK